MELVAEPSQLEGDLGNHHVFRAARHADGERDPPGMAPHDLHDKEAVVAACGVPQLHHRVKGGVHRRVEADGGIRPQRSLSMVPGMPTTGNPLR